MALPKLTTPYYTMNLPSTGEEVKFRPFLVKEEKILLLAMESEDQQEMANALEQIITNCTDGKIDVTTMPLFDVEYLFLQLRIKSVDTETKLSIRCENDVCPPLTIKLDLDKVKVSNLEKEQDFKIELTKDVGLMLKYPTLDMGKATVNTEEDQNKSSYMFEVIIDCIDSIYDEEQSYKASETPREEIADFLDALSSEQFQKVVSFFERMPKLEHKTQITCPHCKRKNKIVLQGLQDFFESASPTTV